MTSQANISNYFNGRKRPCVSSAKNRTKVLVLEAEKSFQEVASRPATPETEGRSIIFKNVEKKETLVRQSKAAPSKKTPQSSKGKKTPASKANTNGKLKQMLLTNFVTKSSNKEPEPGPSCSKQEEEQEVLEVEKKEEEEIPEVKEEKLVPLCVLQELEEEPLPTIPVTPKIASPCLQSPTLRSSSMKVVSRSSTTPHLTSSVARSLNFRESPAKTSATLGPSAPPATMLTPNKVQSMSIAEIKAKLKSSSRAAELKASLSRFDKLSESLSIIQAADEKLKLKHFEAIEVAVPLSPKRSIPFASPTKAPGSPVRLLPSSAISPAKVLGNRLAAWQQYSSFAETRVPTLPLPWHFKCLVERFRAVDVICTMMANRKETISFTKLQSAVQEMTRLNFTEQHLGQIKHLFPEAFKFDLQKHKTFALTGRPDKYELVIVPKYEPHGSGGEEKSKGLVESTVLQQRRDVFHSLLVDKVKDCHEEFLRHLDPPMVVPREKLTRWHPNFDTEQVPEIEVADLPRPPNQEKFTTAKEVLACARSHLSCNSRLTKALENSESSGKQTPVKSEPGIQNDNERTPSHSNSNIPPINPALRGLPNSLLEKIRAKQAARAREEMTRTPAQDKHHQRLSRLPEMARVLRNIFVAEKRGVMPLEMVIEKLHHSFPHPLSYSEMEEHVTLLTSEAPVLLTKLTMRQTHFIKLDRQASMAQVMATLERHTKIC